MHTSGKFKANCEIFLLDLQKQKVFQNILLTFFTPLHHRLLLQRYPKQHNVAIEKFCLTKKLHEMLCFKSRQIHIRHEFIVYLRIYVHSLISSAGHKFFSFSKINRKLLHIEKEVLENLLLDVVPIIFRLQLYPVYVGDQLVMAI